MDLRLTGWNRCLTHSMAGETVRSVMLSGQDVQNGREHPLVLLLTMQALVLIKI